MAQAILIQTGDAIDYASPVDVPAGDVVVMNDLVGVAQQGLQAGIPGAVALKGVFELPKLTGAATALAAGARAYWLNAWVWPSPHRTDLISDPSLADDTTATQIVVSEPALFEVGDTIRVEGSQELMLVTAISANQLTVVRGHDGTVAAGISDGDVIYILNKAKPLGHVVLPASDDDARVRVRLSA